MRGRSGFTVVEVIIASMVLVTALFGILGAAFHTYRKSDISDEYQTGTLLCAERLDYFRAQRNPYLAAGGTFHDPPRDKREVDFNADPRFHFIVNNRPRLFVREYLFSLTERKDALGRDFGTEARSRRNDVVTNATMTTAPPINWVPPTPTSFTEGAAVRNVDGVLPNWEGDDAALGGTQVSPGVFRFDACSMNGINRNADGSNTGFTKDFRFIRAPRANERIVLDGGVNMITRGNELANLPDSIRYIREVWVQTNHPLGTPYSTTQGDTLPNNVGLPGSPGFYTSAVAVPGKTFTYNQIVTQQIARAENPAAGSGAPALPPYVVAVTVRVFRREPTVRTIVTDAAVQANGAVVHGPTGAQRSRGAGYDPSRPLAQMVGYFGLRRNLR